jgi:cytochrome c-type biogenesis protein CcmH
MNFMGDMSTFLAFAGLLLGVTSTLYVLVTRSSSARGANAAARVYQNQLDELAADIASQKLTQAEGEALRTEIARRLLAEANTKDNSGTQNVAGKWLPTLSILMIPAIAVPVYLHIGSPAAEDAPLQGRIEQGVANNDMASMIIKVEQHLQKVPDDAGGWQVIAPIYAQMGRHADAANAYEKLLRLRPPAAETYTSLGEMLVYANQGIVSAEAMRVFQQALTLQPSSPKARFFVATGLKQEGKVADARKVFENMLAEAGPDAPWRKAVERELAALAKAPALTEEQIKSGIAQPESDQQVMIRNMVDGLDARLQQDGSDLDGWLRLIRARIVLGEVERARAAMQRAELAFKGNPDALASIGSLAKELALQ